MRGYPGACGEMRGSTGNRKTSKKPRLQHAPSQGTRGSNQPHDAKESSHGGSHPQSAFCKEFANALVSSKSLAGSPTWPRRSCRTVRVVRESTQERTLTGPLAELCVTINQEPEISESVAHCLLLAQCGQAEASPVSRDPQPNPKDQRHDPSSPASRSRCSSSHLSSSSQK